MTSKLTPTDHASSTPPRLGRLETVAALWVEGPEAMDFLQRQCMSDLRRLQQDAASQWSGLLSAKGRLLCLFRLFRIDAQRFWLVAPGAEPEVLADTLRRYVFRSKLALRSQDGPLGVAIDADQAPGSDWLAWDEGRWIRVDDGSTQDAALDAAWQHTDTLRGVPQIDASLRDRFTPQMLSLSHLQAYSLSKGCYPGQEIVARTHYLGQQKRGLQQIKASRALRAGEPLQQAGRAVGELIQVSRLNPRIGLAVISLDDGGDGLRLEDGSAAYRQPGAADD